MEPQRINKTPTQSIIDTSTKPAVAVPTKFIAKTPDSPRPEPATPRTLPLPPSAFSTPSAALRRSSSSSSILMYMSALSVSKRANSIGSAGTVVRHNGNSTPASQHTPFARTSCLTPAPADNEPDNGNFSDNVNYGDNGNNGDIGNSNETTIPVRPGVHATPRIRAAARDIAHRAGPCTWLIATYGPAMDLQLAAGGRGGVGDMVARLEDDEVQCGLVRVDVESGKGADGETGERDKNETATAEFILICWFGSPQHLSRARDTSAGLYIADDLIEVFDGQHDLHVGLTVFASRREGVTEAKVMQALKKGMAMGSDVRNTLWIE